MIGYDKSEEALSELQKIYEDISMAEAAKRLSMTEEELKSKMS